MSEKVEIDLLRYADLQGLKNLYEQGFGSSQFNLGTKYRDGEGVPQDYKKMIYWYTKAAEQGHIGAQNNLGVIYFEGNGVLQLLSLTCQFLACG